ncbi:hypothetical protein ACNT8L_10465 [Brucella intermedia]|uniref:hypothetical protein n=1 Tax=Brucella intermedia TaxID=94625 RepID=UPI003AB266ED
MPTIVALSRNPIAKARVIRIKEAGHSTMVAIVAVLRKLLHLALGVLKADKSIDSSHVSACA